MKRFFTVLGIALITGNLFAAQGDTVTLNLSQPLNPESFTYTPDGYWVETYNEDNFSMIDFDHFSFNHIADNSFGNYWEGFTICTSGDNVNYIGDYGWDYTKQWGNMAGGGIKTDANGKVLLGANNKPQVEQGIPYLMAFVGYYDVPQTIIYGADEPYEAVGAYVNISPWAYYGNINGDGYAEGLKTDGDYYKLIIRGLNEDFERNGRVVEHYLAKFENGVLTQSPDWEWVDLSTLGEIFGLEYGLESTDVNTGGMRTAAYFALDKLQVRKKLENSIRNTNIDEFVKLYQSNGYVYLKFNNLQGEISMTITDAGGKSVEKSVFEVNHSAVKQISTGTLAKGVYFVTLQNVKGVSTQKLIVY